MSLSWEKSDYPLYVSLMRNVLTPFMSLSWEMWLPPLCLSHEKCDYPFYVSLMREKWLPPFFTCKVVVKQKTKHHLKMLQQPYPLLCLSHEKCDYPPFMSLSWEKSDYPLYTCKVVVKQKQKHHLMGCSSYEPLCTNINSHTRTNKRM